MLTEDVLEQLPFYPAGRGILSGLVVRTPIIMNVRERYTKHGGETLKVAIPKRIKEEVGLVEDKKFKDKEINIKIAKLDDFN